MLDSFHISEAMKEGDIMKKRNKFLTFEDVANEWLEMPSRKKDGGKSEKYFRYAKYLIEGRKNERGCPQLGSLQVIKITDSHIKEYDRYLRKQPGRRKGTFLSAAAINSYAGAYNTIMNFAQKEGYIDSFPTWEKRTEKRNDFLPTEEQIHRFIKELDPLRRDMFVFACHTGLRCTNVRTVKRSQFSNNFRECYFEGDQMKNGLPFHKALNEEARKIVIKYIRLGDELMDKYKWLPEIEHVFIQQSGRSMGKPFAAKVVCNSVWRKARVQASVPSKFKFHSARHYMASTMIRSGIPETVVMQSGGWTGKDSMRDYTHVINKQVTAAAEVTGSFL